MEKKYTNESLDKTLFDLILSITYMSTILQFKLILYIYLIFKCVFI